MSKIILTSESLKLISLFTKITGVPGIDYIETEAKYVFVVNNGSVGKAIGKAAANVKKLEQAFKKKVQIIEQKDSMIEFIKGLSYPAKIADIEEKEGIVYITPSDMRSRSFLIGRNGSALRENETIVRRYFDGLKEIKVNQIK